MQTLTRFPNDARERLNIQVERVDAPRLAQHCAFQRVGVLLPRELARPRHVGPVDAAA